MFSDLLFKYFFVRHSENFFLKYMGNVLDLCIVVIRYREVETTVHIHVQTKIPNS